ncbi:MAG: quinol:cytochrome C oxidoreductase [Chitinophagaceae bacterium]
MVLKEQFEVSSRYRIISLSLMGVGIIAMLAGYFVYGRGDEQEQVRFWSAMLQNSIYFLLIVNAAMFFFCATTLALAGFVMAFRRVTEAISVAVIPLGVVAFIILMALITGHQHHLYHWLTPEGDKILEGKIGFLNPTFFTVWTILSIGLWILLGWKMRKISAELDDNPLPSIEAGRKYNFKNTVWASIYIVWFSLTVASTTPWLWLMSIDAHWYSTMYSWYVFASTFVGGLAVITLFVIYLKNKGYLEIVTKEHLHDLGKFIFAFSIFWTYLWFSQYMLIWYANIPEETVYFKPRLEGAYKGVFWLSFIINFLAPLLILMRSSSKRNYTTLTFISVLLIFGHWLDFYQLVFAGPTPNHAPLGILDFAIAAGFVGLIMYSVARALSKKPLYARNHPFFKETIIHHT